MKVIGLISGTSVDGIDAALIEISGKDWDLKVELISGATYPYPSELREQILAVGAGKPLSMAEMAALDDAIATQFALAAQQIQTAPHQAELIGSHGQTVFHRPPVARNKRNKEVEKQEKIGSEKIPNLKSRLGYSLQLGRGEVIAELTGISTVSNFRVADIAAGGEGAPLVPKVDACLLSHPSQTRCIQNLGGIGNVTYIPARGTDILPGFKLNWEQEVYGWDTGPGNALLDLAVHQLSNGHQTFDLNGSWAAQGTPCQTLVERWLQQDFFQQKPPKSTGRELFGASYLQDCWQDAQEQQLSAADWLATLTELTVASIVQSYESFLPKMPDQVLLCGGGSHNLYLKQRLQTKLASTTVLTTDQAGLNADFKEAIAFAVLAYWRFQCAFPGNLTQVTGANKPMLLGIIHEPDS